MAPRAPIAAMWAVGVLGLELALRGAHALAGWRGLGLGLSLLAWLAAVEGLAQLPARRPTAGVLAVLGLGALVPLCVGASARYAEQLGQPLPPSAVCFLLRNPRYGWALVGEGSSPRERAIVVAAMAGFALALLALTRRPLAPPGPHAPHGRLARAWREARFWAWPALVALVALPRAARSDDLEGLRSTLGGLALWATARPHLDRPARVRPSPTPPARARPSVLLLVQESLGAHEWAPWNGRPGSSPAIEALLAHDPLAHWFPEAQTAAGATAVSLPTILTGLGADAPGEDFVHAPLLWQEARALGYATALFSAEDYDWMSFRRFFLGAEGPDEARVASDYGARRVNDNGVDDLVPVEAAAAFLDRLPRDRPFLVVVQLNATHRPCWAPDAPRGPLEARCRAAARYVDRATAQLLEALRARGRLDETLVLGTADHGETFRPDRPMRLESYFEEVMRVPLWLRLPRALAAERPELVAALATNRARRVGNIDLYPTLLDLWGRWPLVPGERPPLAGQSLFRPIDPERTLVAVNTGDIHDFAWSREGFALYHRRWKWLCDEHGGVQLFDLEADPAERASRAGELRPGAADASSGELRDELRLFRAQVGRRPNLRRILGKIAPELL